MSRGGALLAEFDGSVCPACHHRAHDPGGCSECPRCELHTDEAAAFVLRYEPELVVGVTGQPVIDVDRLVAALVLGFQTDGWNIDGESIDEDDRTHLESVRSLADTVAAEYTYPSARSTSVAEGREVLDHAEHFDPNCEECAYLARPTRETLVSAPERLRAERDALAEDEQSAFESEARLRAAAQSLVDALPYEPGSMLGGKIALVIAALDDRTPDQVADDLDAMASGNFT